MNRARFLLEITETVLKFVESGRVGIKIGPMNVSGAFVANADTLPDMHIEIIVFWVALSQFRKIGDICDSHVGLSHILGGTMRDFKRESHRSTQSPD